MSLDECIACLTRSKFSFQNTLLFINSLILKYNTFTDCVNFLCTYHGTFHSNEEQKLVVDSFVIASDNSFYVEYYSLVFNGLMINHDMKIGGFRVEFLQQLINSQEYINQKLAIDLDSDFDNDNDQEYWYNELNGLLNEFIKITKRKIRNQKKCQRNDKNVTHSSTSLPASATSTSARTTHNSDAMELVDSNDEL